MHQIPSSLWNQIAKTQTLINPSFQVLMSMPAKQMHQTLENQAQALSNNQVPDNVINSYQQIAPLLAENQAISQYINQTDNLSLRQALPEVLTAAEAVAIASRDRLLSKSEQMQLLQMLLPLEPVN